MKTIADIINEWKAITIPLEDGCKFNFEKDCEFEERKEFPMECRIIVKLRDKFTYYNGTFHEKAFLDFFETSHQSESDPTVKAIENKLFENFLNKYTENSVNARRKEIQELRECGQVSFVSVI